MRRASRAGGERDLVILGSTGSIGTQAIDIVSNRPEIRVRALAAGGANLEQAISQAKALRPDFLALARGNLSEVRERINDAGLADMEVALGAEAISEAARRAGEDGIVLNGINGAVGLAPTLAALEAGSQLALANKESLVVGAPLVRAACQRDGQVTPVDSEHSAIAQCLAAGRHQRGLTSVPVTGHTEVSRLILTASGGPFRGRTRAELEGVTPDQALNHPTWAMGPVVTINSSTLMNKALELIEAHVLFDIAPERIDAVVHPQSIVHSMVEFVDGATIVQASPPDMHLPIALALSWPKRWAGIEAPCRWEEATSWDFEPVDSHTFPAPGLAREAMAASHTHPTVLNAANEECVDAFLTQGLPYLAIVDTVADVLAAHDGQWDPTLGDIQAADRWARARARELITARA